MADVANDLKTWSTTESSNGPAGTATIGTGLDENLRKIQAVVRQDLASKGSDVASAATCDLGAVPGLLLDITGTTTITSFGTVSSGIWKVIKFEDALTLTHNATSLILPWGANITTVAGDVAIMFSEGSGNWRCLSYSPVPANQTIRGAVVSGNFQVDGGSFIFNESGGNQDARFEGDTDVNLLFTDASADAVGIGTATPGAKLDVFSASDVGVRVNRNGADIVKMTAVSGSVNMGSGTASDVVLIRNDATIATLGAGGLVHNLPEFLKSYTVGTLPSAATAGGMIYVSNETGGAVPAFSDGTNWRRVTDRTIVS